MPSRFHGFLNERQTVGAGRQHHELAVALLDFAAADFQQARDVERVLAGFFRREHAQHQHFKRHHIDFELGNLIAETQVGINAFGFGNALEAFEFALGAVHVGNVGALVAEQVLGVSPAPVFFADQVFRRDLDVVEPDFVDLALAIKQPDGAHGDARRLHVDQQERNAGLRLAFGIGAHQAKNPFTILPQRGPGFLAIDDEFVAGALGPAFDRCQVGARARLAIALAPPDLAAGDAWQKALLLFRVAKGHDDRRDHDGAKRHHARRTGERAFFLEQMFLHGVPARAAKFPGPAVAEPAFFSENFGPALHVVTRQTQGVVHLVRNISRQAGMNPGADFFAEGLLFRGES